MGPWEVNLTSDVENWYLDLDDDTAELVAAAIDMLEQEGP